MNFRGIFLFLLVGVLTTYVESAVDCKKPLKQEDVAECCKTPEPDISSFEAQCGHYKTPGEKTPTPCFIECMFNYTNLIKDDQLNEGYLKDVLTKMFDGNEEIIQVSEAGFKQCIPTINRFIQETKAKNKWPIENGTGANKCTLHGLFYAACAQKYVFTKCPASIWKATPVCENAKEFVETCVPAFECIFNKKRVRRQVRNEEFVDSTEFDWQMFML